MDTTAARERRIMDSKAFALLLAVISLNCCRFNNIKLSVRSQIMRQPSWSPFKPYLARWNSSRKPARILTIDITTACGWVMGRLKMSIAMTKHRGFGTRPRQDPRRLRSHNRKSDGEPKVSRWFGRIHPRLKSCDVMMNENNIFSGFVNQVFLRPIVLFVQAFGPNHATAD